MDLPILHAKSVQLAALAKVVDFLPWTLVRLALEVEQEVVTVGMDSPALAVGLVAISALELPEL
jgi:hypothetical protein